MIIHLVMEQEIRRTLMLLDEGEPLRGPLSDLFPDCRGTKTWMDVENADREDTRYGGDRETCEAATDEQNVVICPCLKERQEGEDGGYYGCR